MRTKSVFHIYYILHNCTKMYVRYINAYLIFYLTLDLSFSNLPKIQQSVKTRNFVSRFQFISTNLWHGWLLAKWNVNIKYSRYPSVQFANAILCFCKLSLLKSFSTSPLEFHKSRTHSKFLGYLDHVNGKSFHSQGACWIPFNPEKSNEIWTDWDQNFEPNVN